MYQYPSQLDQPQQYLTALGTAWSRYGGRQFVESYIVAVLQAAKQNQWDIGEAADSLSRLKVPTLHRQLYSPIVLRQSDLNSSTASLAHYDETTVNYGQGLLYDRPLVTQEYVFELPAGLTDLWVIENRISDASLVLIGNVDFRLDLQNGALCFRENPFDNPLIPQTPVFRNGQVVDQQITLWAFRAGIDRGTVTQQVGYLVGLSGPSTAPYLDACNQTLDAMAGCTAVQQVLNLVSGWCGIPLIKQESETIEAVGQDAVGQFVATDKTVYRFSPSATVTAQVGDILSAGQSMVSGFEVINLHQGQVPDDLPALTVDQNLLDPAIGSPLLFQNQQLPLLVTSGPSPTVQFSVQGQDDAVTRFWALVEQRGRTQGPTLYGALQAAGGIPATLNPLQFVVANLLRNNVMLIRLQASQFGQQLPLCLDPLLRSILPPRMTLLILIDLPAFADSVTMVQDQQPGTFDAMVPLNQTVLALDGIPA